jgi:serine/threonine protein kinase
LQLLGSGEISQVYAARRVGLLPFLATIKLSSASAAAARYAREAQILRELQGLQSGGMGDYFSQLLPEVIAEGAAEGTNQARHALVLRHANGCWGSLAALNEKFSQGIDPRHAVWIWRRILGVLTFVHSQNRSHGDIRPAHVLVQPRDHGARVIGWADAQKGASPKQIAADLLRSARVILVLLSGTAGGGAMPASVPKELAQFVSRAAQDEDFCQAQGADGLDSVLQAQARAAFGPPTFVPLDI